MAHILGHFMMAFFVWVNDIKKTLVIPLIFKVIHHSLNDEGQMCF